MSRQPFQPPSRGQLTVPYESAQAQRAAYQATQPADPQPYLQRLVHPAMNAYPQHHGYPGYEPPPANDQPYQATEPPPAQEQPDLPPPPPSYELDQAQRQQIITFIHQAMNAALGLQTQIHHFRVRGVTIPADASDQLARLFQDIADSLR